jgi:hypothetical protein
MCTSDEFMNTVAPPFLNPAAVAWLRPTIVAADGGLVIDASGEKGRSLSCDGWSRSSSSHSGLIVFRTSTAQGLIGAIDCSNSYAVACCTPVD